MSSVPISIRYKDIHSPTVYGYSLWVLSRNVWSSLTNFFVTKSRFVKKPEVATMTSIYELHDGQFIKVDKGSSNVVLLIEYDNSREES